MSETRFDGADLDHMEDVASLGYLLNAIAHDLNNQLTNLLLGADQAQYTGSKEAIDLIVDQAQALAGITRAVQGLGQRNMDRGRQTSELGPLLQQAAAWQEQGGRGAVGLTVPDEAVISPVVGRHMALGLSMGFRWVYALHPTGPLSASLSVEEVPRSAWSGNSETVPMAVVRLRSGDPSADTLPQFKALVDDFFGAERAPEEVGLMACWEILRKVRGRMEANGGATGVQLVFKLPLAAA